MGLEFLNHKGEIIIAGVLAFALSLEYPNSDHKKDSIRPNPDHIEISDYKKPAPQSFRSADGASDISGELTTSSGIQWIEPRA